MNKFIILATNSKINNIIFVYFVYQCWSIPTIPKEHLSNQEKESKTMSIATMILLVMAISLKFIKDQTLSLVHVPQKENTVAIKVVSLDQLKSKHLEELVFQEIRILQQMNHPNILRFYEALLSQRNCYIVTELCNEGDLQSRLKKGRLADLQFSRLVIDIYSGLKYLKQMGVCHRDIKTANIFLHNGQAKIADFGLAKFFKQRFHDLDIGSPLYMSPQGLIFNFYSDKTDIWAFGIILYEIIHGTTPFASCKTEMDLKSAVNVLIPQNKFSKNIHPYLRQLINSLLQINQFKRPNIYEIKNQPFIQLLLNNKDKNVNKNTFNMTQSINKDSTNNTKINNSSITSSINYTPRLPETKNYQLSKGISPKSTLIIGERALTKRFDSNNLMVPKNNNLHRSVQAKSPEKKPQMTFTNNISFNNHLKNIPGNIKYNSNQNSNIQTPSFTQYGLPNNNYQKNYPESHKLLQSPSQPINFHGQYQVQEPINFNFPRFQLNFRQYSTKTIQTKESQQENKSRMIRQPQFYFKNI